MRGRLRQLMSAVDLKPCTGAAYHNEKLKLGMKPPVRQGREPPSAGKGLRGKWVSETLTHYLPAV